MHNWYGDFGVCIYAILIFQRFWGAFFERFYDMIISEANTVALIIFKGELEMKKKVKITPDLQIQHNEIEDKWYSIRASVYSNDEYLGEIEGDYYEVLCIHTLQKLYGFNKIPDISKEEFCGIKADFDEALINIKTVNYYAYTGLSNDGTKYILYNNCINKNGITEIVNESSKCTVKLSESPSSETFSKHIECMVSVMKHQYFSIIIILTKLLSMYTSQLRKRQYQPSFALFVRSDYNTGKTTAVNTLVNPFNTYTASFEDTQAAIITSMKNFRDDLLIIDDMTSAMINSMTQKVEHIIRIAGDKTTLARKMKGTKLDESHNECMVLMTGEELSKLQNSSYTRMLILDWCRDEIDWDKLTQLQHDADITTWFYVKFLEYSLQNENFIDTLLSTFLSHRKVYIDKFKHHSISNRYIDMCSWIMAMFNLLSNFLCSVGINTASLCSDFPAQLEELIVSLGKKYSYKSATSAFVTGLFTLKDNNKLNIVSRGEALEGKDFDIMAEDNLYFIKSTNVYEKISSYYRGLNIDFRYSERAIRDDLFKNNLLKKGSKYLTSEFKTRSNKSISGFYFFAREARNKYYKEEI